ncbi:MAG TPA: C45 family peptidase [Paracoccaceae bacterium]|nr:C45 family peptidase [Paracoccaceae bacterium]
MSFGIFPAADPMILSGGAWARGHGQSADSFADVARVREATIGRVQTARAEGLIDAHAEVYLRDQALFHAANDPSGMAELQGIADGFGLPDNDLFAHLHLGTLRDLKLGAKLDGDGCSAWAVSDGPDGPIVVKNRDYSGLHLGIQRLTSHRGPDIKTGELICLGSLGSPAAYSSGINAKGLALADTQVSVAGHGVGWLRYFLMTRVLAISATVAEAVKFIKSVPHAGGGTLILADATGAVAAVELASRKVNIEQSALVWRTNHFVSEDLASETLLPESDKIAGNSADRFAYLGRRLPDLTPGIPQSIELMKSHRDAALGSAPLCQHDVSEASQTLSTAIYSCSLRSMAFSQGNPCTGQWQTCGMSS